MCAKTLFLMMRYTYGVWSDNETMQLITNCYTWIQITTWFSSDMKPLTWFHLPDQSWKFYFYHFLFTPNWPYNGIRNTRAYCPHRMRYPSVTWFQSSICLASVKSRQLWLAAATKRRTSWNLSSVSYYGRCGVHCIHVLYSRN